MRFLVQRGRSDMTEQGTTSAGDKPPRYGATGQGTTQAGDKPPRYGAAGQGLCGRGTSPRATDQGGAARHLDGHLANTAPAGRCEQGALLSMRHGALETLMSSGCVRSTLSLDPDVHRVLRFKAALLHGSMCAIVNDAVRAALREDEDDLAVFAERAAERR